MKERRSRTLRALTALYAALLAIGSLLPSGSGRLGDWDRAIAPSLQNLLHVPAYAVLVILAALAWRWPHRARLAAVSVTALACVAFGALLEWGQSAVPGRTGSVSDALMNTVGVVAGIPLVLMLRKPAGRGKKESDPEGEAGTAVSDNSR